MNTFDNFKLKLTKYLSTTFGFNHFPDDINSYNTFVTTTSSILSTFSLCDPHLRFKFLPYYPSTIINDAVDNNIASIPVLWKQKVVLLLVELKNISNLVDNTIYCDLHFLDYNVDNLYIREHLTPFVQFETIQSYLITSHIFTHKNFKNYYSCNKIEYSNYKNKLTILDNVDKLGSSYFLLYKEPTNTLLYNNDEINTGNFIVVNSSLFRNKKHNEDCLYKKFNNFFTKLPIFKTLLLNERTTPYNWITHFVVNYNYLNEDIVDIEYVGEYNYISLEFWLTVEFSLQRDGTIYNINFFKKETTLYVQVTKQLLFTNNIDKFNIITYLVKHHNLLRGISDEFHSPFLKILESIPNNIVTYYTDECLHDLTIEEMKWLKYFENIKYLFSNNLSILNMEFKNRNNSSYTDLYKDILFLYLEIKEDVILFKISLKQYYNLSRFYHDYYSY